MLLITEPNRENLFHKDVFYILWKYLPPKYDFNAEIQNFFEYSYIPKLSF